MVASRFNIDDIATTLGALDAIGRFAVQVQQPFFDLGRPDGCRTPGDLARLRRDLGDAAREGRAEAGDRQARPVVDDGPGVGRQRSVSAIVAAKTSCLIESAVTPNMYDTAGVTAMRRPSGMS